MPSAGNCPRVKGENTVWSVSTPVPGDRLLFSPITVQDDGVGFHVSRQAFKPGRQGGYGLFSIRERLEYLGGKVTVESTPGRGTKAALALTLNHDTIKSGS